MAAQQQPADEDKYQKHTEELKNFLLNFKEADLDGQEQDKYMNVLQQVANRRVEQVIIELEDIFQNVGEEMADAISKNTSRYRRLLADAIDAVMPGPTEDLAAMDIADVLSKQRQERSHANTDAAASDPQQQIPPELLRRYEVRLLPRHKEKAVALREVRASSVGSLLTVKGIVTRVTEVKPRMKVATYTCEQGGFEAYQTVNGREFMPLFQCPSAGCCTGGRLHLQTRGCKFGKFQEVKIQEEADQARGPSSGPSSGPCSGPVSGPFSAPPAPPAACVRCVRPLRLQRLLRLSASALLRRCRLATCRAR